MRFMLSAGLSAGLSTALLAASTLFASASDKRPPTVADSILLTEIGEPWDDLLGRDVAHYSPDGSHFVVVTRTGNIASDSVDYALLMYTAEASGKISAPRILTTVSSTSNSPGIADLKWYDNDTVLFRSASGSKPMQLNSVSIRAGTIREKIVADTAIAAYGVNSNGSIVFLAQPQPAQLWNEKTLREGLVISNELLSDLLAGHSLDNDESGTVSPYELRVLDKDGTSRRVSTANYKPLPASPVVAPDGAHAVIQAWVDKASVNPTWAPYRGRMAAGVSPAGYVLADHKKMSSRLLLDAPMSEFLHANVVWTSNTTVAIASAHLPLSMVGGGDPELIYAIEVDIEAPSVTVISRGLYRLREWDTATQTLTLERADRVGGIATPAVTSVGGRITFIKQGRKWVRIAARESPLRSRPKVVVRQGINLPPSLIAESNAGRTAILLEPNRRLSSVQLSPVEEISWLGDGDRAVTGGLYLPPGHVKGKTYPLILQTHGWFGKRFSMDGLSSAAYSAQALAGKGYAVVQVPDIGRWEGTAEEGPRNMALYESAVDYLGGRGLVDRDRIGILGWSRTGYHVRYALAFSRIRYGAAVIADGMDGSYGQYISLLNRGPPDQEVYEAINGGVPFGSGLQQWTESASGFNLHRVRTPTRLLTFSPPVLLCNWEWFVGLRRLGTPVEHVWLKDAAHAPIKPSHRLVAQQGTVDWFDFWLNGDERADGDVAQYERWRQLRDTYRLSGLGSTHTELGPAPRPRRSHRSR